MTVLGPNVSRRLRPVLGAVAVAALLALGAAARADEVTVFSQVPSVDTVKCALGVTSCRSIQIDEGAASGATTYATPPAAAATTPVFTGAPPPLANGAPPPRQKVAKATGGAPKAVGLPINFGFNSAEISPESQPYLDVIGKLMAGEPKARLVVEGHTDAVGDRTYNVQLSRRRALAVREAIVKGYGIAPGRLTAVGRGPDDPLPGTDPKAQVNRRVQFRLRG